MGALNPTPQEILEREPVAFSGFDRGTGTATFSRLSAASGRPTGETFPLNTSGVCSAMRQLGMAAYAGNKIAEQNLSAVSAAGAVVLRQTLWQPRAMRCED
jgi:hypothetical protein